MTHRDVVKRARAWLKKIEKCTVVVTERGATNAQEIPDAIGWKAARHSILIECKTSRSDFRADSKKWFRQDGLGMGQTRYFMAPIGIIPPDELPPGWGLLELIDKETVQVTRKCDLLCFDEMRCWAELPLLTAVIRKLQYSNALLRKEIRERKTKRGKSSRSSTKSRKAN